MSHDVFISYSTQNKSDVFGIVEALERAGVPCWIAPRDIPEGEPWPESIIEALDESVVVAVMLSRDSLDSKEVEREVSQAGKRPIISIRIEMVEPAPTMRYFLGPAQWIDVFGPPDIQSHHERITRKVKQLVAREKETREADEPTPFVPAPVAMLDDLSTKLDRFQDLAVKLLTSLGESSRLLSRNEEARATLIELATAFNKFAPEFNSSLSNYAATIRQFWGMDPAARFAKIQRTIEEDIYRRGIGGTLNDARVELNDFMDREDVQDAEWKDADRRRRTDVKQVRGLLDEVTRNWAALRTELDHGL